MDRMSNYNVVATLLFIPYICLICGEYALYFAFRSMVLRGWGGVTVTVIYRNCLF